jgi:hypothetical protein
VAIVPSTGAITFGQILKELNVKALVLAIVEGRGYAFPSPVLTAAQLNSIATLIEAAYDIFANNVVQPLTSPPTYNNQLIVFPTLIGIVGGMLANNPDLLNGLTSGNTFLDALGAVASEAAIGTDALVPFDAAISAASSNGTPLAANSSAAAAEAMYGKSMLAFSLAFAKFYNRNTGSVGADLVGVTTAQMQALGASIAGAYNAMVANISGYNPSTVKNPILWNAAFCGFICGELSGRGYTSTSSSDPAYLALSAAAAVFATEVDATVGASDTVATPVPAGSTGGLSTVEAVTVPPTTGTLIEVQLAKSNLMWGLCRALYFGRWLNGSTVDTTSTTYQASAQAIVALYLQTALVALNTP